MGERSGGTYPYFTWRTHKYPGDTLALRAKKLNNRATWLIRFLGAKCEFLNVSLMYGASVAFLSLAHF